MSNPKNCNCIKLCNAELEKSGSNTRLDIPFEFSFSTGKLKPPRCFIATCKADPKKREKPMPLAASYCPICGKKYHA